MSRQRDIGTKAETAVVRALLAQGIPAERRALKGSADEGDVWAFAGRIVIEVKVRRTRPSDEEIARLWDEANRESLRVAQCDAAALVLKRPGKTDPMKWWAVLAPPDYLWLMGLGAVDLPTPTSPEDLVTTPLGSLVRHILTHPDLGAHAHD